MFDTTSIPTLLPRPVKKADMCQYYTAKIAELLKVRPMTRDQLAEALGVNIHTMRGYLRRMRSIQRTIRPSGEYLAECVLWELGEDPTMPDRAEQNEDYDPRRPVVPARQIGMQRDPLVTALFGPAA
jgi:transcriptional regulator with XRE-family HTH domain